MTKSYVRVLKESLCRKKEILKELLTDTAKQTELIDGEEIGWDEFERIMEHKEKLIEELEKLDDGFDLVFQRVQEELTGNPKQYETDIQFMKGLIRDITSLSTSLEADENRNKTAIERRMLTGKKELHRKKVSAKAATTYYQNAKQFNFVDPQLLDKKN